MLGAPRGKPAQPAPPHRPYWGEVYRQLHAHSVEVALFTALARSPASPWRVRAPRRLSPQLRPKAPSQPPPPSPCTSPAQSSSRVSLQQKRSRLAHRRDRELVYTPARDAEVPWAGLRLWPRVRHAPAQPACCPAQLNTVKPGQAPPAPPTATHLKLAAGDEQQSHVLKIRLVLSKQAAQGLSSSRARSQPGAVCCLK